MFPKAGHIFLSLLLVPCASVSATEFTVESWDLLVGVQTLPGDSAAHSFFDVQSPFVATHSVTLPGFPLTSASASYDFAFDEAAGLGRFLIESTIAADGVSSGNLISSSDSRINISPLEPITVQVHGEYTYNIPGDIMDTRFHFIAIGLDSGTVAFSDGLAVSSTTGPHSGLIVIDGEFELTPELWQLGVTMRNDSSTGSLGHTSTGTGFLEIVIPEPCTILLLLCALPFARRARRTS